jgi:hypothetical protein
MLNDIMWSVSVVVGLSAAILALCATVLWLIA